MAVFESGLLSERLVEVREARGLNQSELAKLVGGEPGFDLSL